MQRPDRPARPSLAACRTLVAVAVAVTGAAALSAAGCLRRKAVDATEPASAQARGEVWLSPRAVEQAHVLTRTIGPTEVGGVVSVAGRVAYDDLSVEHIFSPVAGKVLAVCAEPGQKVSRGDPLAQIASPDLGTAISDVDKARADRAAAAADFRRQRELFAQGAAARRDLDTAEDVFDTAVAELSRAADKARLLGAGSHGDARQRYTLRAAIDGEVISRSVAVGQELQGQYSGGSGNELFTVANLATVWVLADLYEVDVGRVHLGQRVDVAVTAYPTASFAGRVEWISDVLDPTLRTAKLRLSLANPDGRLKPDMFATARIAAGGTPALTVPRSAVVHMGEKTVVFVETMPAGVPRRFVRRPVILDEDDEAPGGPQAEVPVLHGLAAGEAVVVAGAEALAEAL